MVILHTRETSNLVNIDGFFVAVFRLFLFFTDIGSLHLKGKNVLQMCCNSVLWAAGVLGGARSAYRIGINLFLAFTYVAAVVQHLKHSPHEAHRFLSAIVERDSKVWTDPTSGVKAMS